MKTFTKIIVTGTIAGLAAVLSGCAGNPAKEESLALIENSAKLSRIEQKIMNYHYGTMIEVKKGIWVKTPERWVKIIQKSGSCTEDPDLDINEIPDEVKTAVKDGENVYIKDVPNHPCYELAKSYCSSTLDSERR